MTDRRAAPTADPLGGGGRHLAFVDALRGYAILWVMLLHASLRMPPAVGVVRSFALAGGSGVQLFFVVSAYTLFRSLGRRRTADRRPWAAFFLRRAFRVVPLFWLGVLFYVGHPDVYRPVLAPGGIGWPHVVATLLLVHGWYPTTFTSVVPGGWSIGAEAMFYLCLPILYRTVRTLRASVGLVVASGLAVAASVPAAEAAWCGTSRPPGRRWCGSSWG